MPYIPQEIIEELLALDIKTVAEKLGITVRRGRTALCFMHSDHHPSLAFSKNGKCWKCFVCGKGGNTIQLVMEYNKMEFVDACIWLCDTFDIPINGTYHRPVRRNQRRIPQPIIQLPNKETMEKPFSKEIVQWIIDHAKLSPQAEQFLFQERRLDRDVIQRLRIGSVSDATKLQNALQANFSQEQLLKYGILKEGNGRLHLTIVPPCLLFPYYDEHGELVGLQTRYIGNNANIPRFLFITQKRQCLFNLQIIKDLPKGSTLYLSEGVTDCLAMLSNGLNAVALPSATIIPYNDIRKLTDYKLCMYPDNDNSGQKGYLALFDAVLRQKMYLSKQELPKQFKDYACYYMNLKHENE